jgi:hypothetical protein
MFTPEGTDELEVARCKRFDGFRSSTIFASAAGMDINQ